VAGILFGTIVLETVVARALALRDPETALKTTAVLVRPIHALTYPLLAPVHATFRRWARTAADDDEREEDLEEEDVEAFIEVGEREGILEKSEGEMVRGIVDLDQTLVREIMTPRVEVVVLAADATVLEARRVALEAGHSRFPRLRGTIDNVLGILHVRDLLREPDGGSASATIAPLVRPAVFVPETRTVAEVLAEMRTRAHVALVVDEYGGFAGLVTLEDLLEEIVGDIRDEHEREEVEVAAQPDGSWILSGLAHAEEIERLFGVDLGERDYDTVGGFVTAALGRVPVAGRSVREPRPRCRDRGRRPAPRAAGAPSRGRPRPASVVRSGHVAIAGWTNVGKSSLLNRLVGREDRRGRRGRADDPPPHHGRPHAPDRGQIVFVDTPGFHHPARG
jgi:magnesium and cobalt transporter